MHRYLLLVAAFAASALAQESSAPARRSPEQVFGFFDKDSSGTLSEAEFGTLAQRFPSLKERPEAGAAMFKRLDKDGNGSLTLDEYRTISAQGSRRAPVPGAPGTPAPSKGP